MIDNISIICKLYEQVYILLASLALYHVSNAI